MTKPYELFIRFLVTNGAEDFEDVNLVLTELSLQEIDEKYFEKITNFVQNNLPKNIQRQIETKKYEGDFSRWMKILDVWELWEYDVAFRNKNTSWIKIVYDIHTDAGLRHSVNALLLKGDLPKDICQDMNNKYSYMLRENHINLYLKFFWNPSLMTRRSWKSYIKLCDNFEKNLMFLCLTETTEVIRTFLELPTKSDISGSLQSIFTQSMQKVKHYLKTSTKEANWEARAWIKTCLEVAEKYKKYETGDIEDFGKTLQMKFDYVDMEFPVPDPKTLAELESNKKRLEEGNRKEESDASKPN